MDDAGRVSWEELLNPEILRSRLVTASVYIAAFQLLKDSIVGRIRGFYMVSDVYKEVSLNYESDYKRYQSEVLARNRSPVYACLDWLKESQVIGEADISVFESVKELRNQIAHTFSHMLTRGLPTELPNRFNDLVSLLDRIERWWIVNVDIATDPEFHGKEIDERGVVAGRTIALRLLADVALGSEEQSKKYLEEFIRQTRPARPS